MARDKYSRCTSGMCTRTEDSGLPINVEEMGVAGLCTQLSIQYSDHAVTSLFAYEIGVVMLVKPGDANNDRVNRCAGYQE